MGLDADFANAEKAVTTAKQDTELAKTECPQVCSSEKKNTKGNKSEGTIPNSDALTSTKVNHEKAIMAIAAAKLAITTEGAKLFKLYGNLLSDKARQPWEKIIKAQVTHTPWEDVYGVTHTETPTKTWDLFCNCVMFHLH